MLAARESGRPESLSKDDIVNARFAATKFRDGYSQDEVDDLLDRVALTPMA